MIKKEIAIILVHAKKQNKWVSVKHLVKYGMHSGIMQWLINQDYIHMRNNYGDSTQIKLNMEGYKYLSALLTKPELQTV